MNRFALKIMHIEAIRKSKELQILKNFSSPYLVGYEDSFFVVLGYCIIFEYCEVISKASLLKFYQFINFLSNLGWRFKQSNKRN